MADELLTAQSLLGGSAYDLTIFDRRELGELKLFWRNDKPYLKCHASGKPRPAKPGEIVRQLYIGRLISRYGYPRERIAVERPVYFGSVAHQKAADIPVMDKDDPASAYIIVEVRKPRRRDGEEQLKSYCNAGGKPHWRLDERCRRAHPAPLRPEHLPLPLRPAA